MTYPGKSNAPVLNKPIPMSPLRLDPWLIAALACFMLLASASWGKVELPIIDVGREVEIPARLVAGQVLYRDVATYYGPLAYYANALALLLFGHHLEVFYTVGIALSLAATLLFYQLAKRLTEPRWAFLCTVCMLIYCAMGPGLFYFLMPYSYGAVYATVLCLLAIATFERYACTSQTRWLVVAAIACGFAGLAKQEYGIAVLAGVLVGANVNSSQNLRTRVGHSILAIAVAGACVLIPLALLAKLASWEKVYLSLLPIANAGVLNHNKLLQVSPAKTLSTWWDTFKVFATASLVVWGAMTATRWLSKRKWVIGPEWLRVVLEVLVSCIFALIGLGLLCKVFFSFEPTIIFRPLGNLSWFLPVSVGLVAISYLKPVRHKHGPLLWTLLVFSLVLNARWLFYIGFYGLYATPVVLLFFTLLYHLSQRIRASLWRYLLICLLIGSIIKLGGLAMYRYAVHSPHGTLYTKDAALAQAFNQTIKTINASGATSVLALPEGSILTFMTATHSPSREITFLPVTLPTVKAEQDFLANMQTNPPELIIYVSRPFTEWGYQTYADFNPLVDRWITQQHKLVDLFPMDKGDIRIYARDR